MKLKLNKDGFHVLHPHVTLGPGVNEVHDKVWAEVEGHPHVKAMLESGQLEIVSEKKAEKKAEKKEKEEK